MGGLDFTRWFISAANFHPLNEKAVFGTRGFYGQFRRDTINEIKTFESENFPLGGGSTLRGTHPLAYTGENRLLFNFEYRQDLNKTFQGVLFHDTGIVYGHNNTPRLSDFKSGTGLGLRYLAGLIPFRLDFAWGEDMIIHFNIGQTF